MKLACEGCDWVAERETADELRAAMMTHGEEGHPNLYEGKTSDELREMKKMMSAHQAPTWSRIIRHRFGHRREQAVFASEGNLLEGRARANTFEPRSGGGGGGP